MSAPGPAAPKPELLQLVAKDFTKFHEVSPLTEHPKSWFHYTVKLIEALSVTTIVTTGAAKVYEIVAHTFVIHSKYTYLAFAFGVGTLLVSRTIDREIQLSANEIIKDQAARALRIYNSIVGELEAKILLFETSVATEIAQLKLDNEGLKTEKNTLTKAKEAAELRAREADEKVDGLNQRIRDLEATPRPSETTTPEIDGLRKNIETLTREKEALKGEKETLTRGKEEALKKAQEANDKVDGLNQRIRDLEATPKPSETTAAEIAGLRKNIETLTREKEALTGEKETLTRAKEEALKKAERADKVWEQTHLEKQEAEAKLAKEIEELKDKLAKATEDGKGELKQLQESSSLKIKESKEAKAEAETALAEAQEEIKKLKKEKEDQKKSLDDEIRITKRTLAERIKDIESQTREIESLQKELALKETFVEGVESAIEEEGKDSKDGQGSGDVKQGKTSVSDIVTRLGRLARKHRKESPKKGPKDKTK